MKKGFIIIFAFIILIFLVGVSIVFLIISGTTQKESGMFKLRLKSQYAAESGIEMAVTHLKKFFVGNYLVPPYTNWLYFGEDINRNYEQDVVENILQDNFLNINSLPIDKAILPSLPNWKETVGIMDSKPYYVSGITERDSFGTIAYRIKILDNSQRIYYKLPTIKLFLNNLKEIFPLHIFTIEKIARYLEQKLDYETIIRLLETEEEKSFFKELFTNYTYQRDVVKPSPVLTKGQIIRSFKEVWVKKEFTKELRAPININNCRPEVLYAMLANVKGLYIDLNDKAESPFSRFLTFLGYKSGDKFVDKFITQFGIRASITNMYFNNKALNPPDKVYLGTVKEHKFDSEKARKIVDDIMEKRRRELVLRAYVAFDTYESVWNFLISLAEDFPEDYNYYDAHLLWSILYPKGFVNWFNPNYYTFREFSKIDLIDYTTEMILGPGGYFDIESEGVVVSNNNIEAKSKTSATVKIFDIYTDSVQSDFEKGIISSVVIPFTRKPFTPPTKKRIIPLKVYPFTNEFSHLKDIGGYLSLNISDYENLNDKNDLAEGYYITNPEDTISPKLARIFNEKFKNCSIELDKENKAEVDDIYINYDKFQKNKMFSGGVSFWIKPQFINYGYNKISPSPICGTITYMIQDRIGRIKQIINEFGYIFLDEEDLFFGASTNPSYETLFFTDDIKKQSEDEFKLPPKTWTHIAFLWGDINELKYKEEEKKYYYNTPDKFIKFYVNKEEVVKTINKIKTMQIRGNITYESESNLDEFFNDKAASRIHWIMQDAPFEFTISKVRTDIKNYIDVLKEYVEGIYYNGQKTSFFTSRQFRLEKPGYFGSLVWNGFSYSQPVENFGNYISVINMQLLDESKEELFSDRITDPRGVGKFNILLRNKFQYRAYFDINILDSVDTEPILNPPILDEVMIIIVRLSPEFIIPVQ